MNLQQAYSKSREIGALVQAVDATLLGPIASWPQSLRTALSITLSCGFPLSLVVGQDPASALSFYNETFIPFLGRKHPAAMGRRMRDTWPEIWDFLDWALSQVWQTGQPVTGKDLLLRVERSDQPEEIFASISLSAIWDDAGQVCGVLMCAIETTEQVVAARRERALRAIAEGLSEARTEEDLCCRLEATLAMASKDLPFSALYGVEAKGQRAVLRTCTGLDKGTPVTPHEIDLRGEGDACPWPLGRVMSTREPELVSKSELSCPALVPSLAKPRLAVVVPIVRTSQERPLGMLVAGLNPLQHFDAAYRGFVQHIAREIATATANVQTLQDARRRADALAEIDRLKTTFLSNISHEFRTPLTLLIGVIEEMLDADDIVPTPQQPERLQSVRRNAYRLLRYVNSLLDFVSIEAGRGSVIYEPMDLAAFTREIVSSFESAATIAGIRLIVDCPPLPEPVFIAADMWEQIVLNLLSNALKFTFAGEIVVTLRAEEANVRLTVRDTGTGIPSEEMPHLFERFYRVPQARGRTHEGVGIGLALVKELVQLHGGSIQVSSTLGEGSTFTVEIPRGSAHLPQNRVRTKPLTKVDPRGATPFVEDALGWLSPSSGASAAPASPSPHKEKGRASTVQVLVVEDSADMRSYLTRLLEGAYEVQAVPDAEAALASARSRAPDVVLSDIIMPGMGGIALLRALRSDPKLRDVPVLLLSARGGEEATVEALESGADDYIVKPFSARELLARVRTHLGLAQARRDAAESQFKESFLNILSHELRTPIASLSLNIHLLEREFDGENPRQSARLDAIRRSVDRITALVDEMLTVSELREGRLSIQRSRCDLVEVCRAAAAEQTLLTRRTPVLDLPKGPIVLEVDRDCIALVIKHLLSNAFKFSTSERPVTLTLRSAEHEVIVSVRDEGPGLTAEEIPRLFERFYRAPGVDVRAGSYVGLGLGLFISRAIVEQHGGRIWAEGEIGKGSTFSFSLPLSGEKQPTRPAHKSNPPATPGRGERDASCDAPVDHPSSP